MIRFPDQVRRRAALGFVITSLLAVPVTGQSDAARLNAVLDAAERLKPLKAVALAQHGTIIAERGYRGHTTTAPTNIKSASKSIMSALVGIAIERGILEGVDQPIAPLLAGELPDDPDPRLAEVTIGHLLSMQSGLAHTSGENYGPWILTSNWVRTVLAQPFVDEPGGAMVYSTGSTHLLSAILTRITGLSTLELATEWLGPLENFHIQDWQRDPQGIYFGGNQMAMSARSLLAFGELYRNCGRSSAGAQVISGEWIERSWQPRTRSQYSGDGYGYGWFRKYIGGQQVAYAWGYGGQMLYVVPAIGVTVAMTSNDYAPAGRNGYDSELHRLMAEIVRILTPSASAQYAAIRPTPCRLDHAPETRAAGHRPAQFEAAEPTAAASHRPS
jgi:CubicO group peptidase (beta-lactamase class C family)